MNYSIIATTYNQPIDLELYLRSLLAQTRADFEILIADDGSGTDTRAVIEEYKPRFGDRLRHVWHEDAGYRKSKILNAAIRESRGRWLIFTDSDLVVHPRFVEDHISQEERGSMFMGRRVDLNAGVSEWIRKNPEKLYSAEFYARVLASGSRNAHRVLRMRLLNQGRVPDLLGSNFSICRDLLIRVNGFDEGSEHYWGEDGDLFVRVRNSGAHIHGRKGFAVQCHLWHPQRSPKPDAEQAYRRKLESRDYVVCESGLSRTSL